MKRLWTPSTLSGACAACFTALSFVRDVSAFQQRLNLCYRQGPSEVQGFHISKRRTQVHTVKVAAQCAPRRLRDKVWLHATDNINSDGDGISEDKSRASIDTVGSNSDDVDFMADNLDGNELGTEGILSLVNIGTSDTTEIETTQSFKWTAPTLAIAIPALIGMIADPLLSLMDTLYVSRLGSIELAALGACTSIFHLAFNVFRATTAATTSLVASELNGPHQGEYQNCSARVPASPSLDLLSYFALLLVFDPVGRTLDESQSNVEGIATRPKPTDSARYVLSTTFQFSTVLGILVASILTLTSTFSLKCMGVPGTSPLYVHAASYLRLRALAAPAVLFITVGEGAFRGYGDTRVPLMASMAAALTNAVLDPLMMFTMNMGVGGAAAATAISQVVAMMVYVAFLRKRGMCMPVLGWIKRIPNNNNRQRQKQEESDLKIMGEVKAKIDRKKVIMTIVKANMSMLIKQFSLLFCWAYATSRATKIGHLHVAAHQVALSMWLVFALLQDGLAVAAQVLMSRVAGNTKQVRSLTKYMVKLAILQSALCSLTIFALEEFVPTLFSTDVEVIQRLHSLMPVLTAFQPLVSITLILESIAVGGKCFNLLARGTLVATLASMTIISRMATVEGIWKYGLTSLFLGRCVTALIGVLQLNEIQISFWRSRSTTTEMADANT
jgi:putative MATE family efflux protein